MSSEAGSMALDALWDFNDPAVSEARFRNYLSQPDIAGDPIATAEVMTQIARAQGLQRQFDRAHSTLDGIDESVRASSPLVQVRYLLERGRVFNSASETQHAIPLFREAWKVAGEPALDYYAVDAAHMLAIALPPEEQPTWAERGIERAKASEDQRARRWLGPLCNNLGWTRHDAGEYTAALTLFEAALAAYTEQGKPGPIRIAKWAVARCLRSLGRVDEALDRQRQILAELESAGASDGYVNEEMGECLLALGKADEAVAQFQIAYTLLSEDPWLVEHEAERLERLRALGDHAEASD